MTRGDINSGAIDRPRVVHVIDSLAGSGGAENRLVDEVLALQDRFEQTVIRLFAADTLESRLRQAGIPVIAMGFRSDRAGWSWPVVGHRLTGELRRLRPDLIHTSLFTGNLVGQLAGARLCVPVVSTFNRTGELTLQRALQPGVASWKGRVMQAIGRRAARRGDVHHRAVGVYARATNCASMGLPLNAATVVPRGVDVARSAEWDSPGRGDVGLPLGAPLFVNVGRVVPEKGQELLVEAFARVRKELPDACLIIVGAFGSAEAAVREAVAAADLDGAVRLLGHREDVRALVAAADVFAFSSISEGSPGAVVEAMALGTPLAGFAIPPVRELTDDGRLAWLAPPGDASALADAMVAAWQSPERLARTAEAQGWAQTRFSLAAVAIQLATLFDARMQAHARSSQ